MKRNWDEERFFKLAEALICAEEVGSDLSKIDPELRLPDELKFMNKIDGVVIGLQGCRGELKGWFELQAVGARLGSFEDAVEGVATSETSV